jgi:hypothetical protein
VIVAICAALVAVTIAAEYVNDVDARFAVGGVGSMTVTVAVACDAAPWVSVAVKITLVTPPGYGPAGYCVSVTGEPSGSYEPLLMLAFTDPPRVADVAVTFCAIATGNAWTVQLMAQAGI